ncbi:hypothetical protein AB4371_19955 [Vibrio sp. 10N.261.51.A3]|uniref:hypothetical protein n=1 Tax=unclassified Vibrio TaxID=2614977 RepID=UPI00354B7DB5
MNKLEVILACVNIPIYMDVEENDNGEYEAWYYDVAETFSTKDQLDKIVDEAKTSFDNMLNDLLEKHGLSAHPSTNDSWDIMQNLTDISGQVCQICIGTVSHFGDIHRLTEELREQIQSSQ